MTLDHPPTDIAQERLEPCLIRQAQADPSAFAPLYQRYFGRVYAYLHARAGSEEDAADLTQQVFLQALAALPRYRDQGVSFAAWLFRIAHNTWINQGTRQRTTLSWDLVPSTHPALTEGGDGLERLLHADDLAQLRRLFQALTHETQELLILRFTIQLTIAEIAVVIGKSEAATQKRLTRTLQRLQEHYHDHA
jgi:RNA polymerase sigma-70 factor (ECF subfamily)